MTKTETICSSCGSTCQSRTDFCPECGAKDPWEEEPLFEFNEDDLPIIFSTRIARDNWALWDDFCYEYFGSEDLTENDIHGGMPENFPRLKEIHLEVFWGINEDMEVFGPEMSRDAVKEKM